MGLHHCLDVCVCVLVPVRLGPSWSDTNKMNELPHVRVMSHITMTKAYSIHLV